MQLSCHDGIVKGSQNAYEILVLRGVFSVFQKSCPGWKDAKSIVAMLRCCNYNQDDCISMYQTINDDGQYDSDV